MWKSPVMAQVWDGGEAAEGRGAPPRRCAMRTSVAPKAGLRARVRARVCVRVCVYVRVRVRVCVCVSVRVCV